MSKLRPLVMTIVVLNLLIAAGLVGFLLATGRLDGAKSKVVLDLLKHKGTPAGLRENVAEIMAGGTKKAAATQVVEAPRLKADEGAMSGVASATDRVEYARQAMEQERLRLDREAQDLQHRQELLEVQRHQTEAQLAQAQADEKRFRLQMQAAQARAKDENFARCLALYDTLEAKQVKGLFWEMKNVDEVSEYIKAMDPDRAGKIIGEFKSLEERQFILGVMEKIRTAGMGTASEGGSPATMPAANSQARS